MTYQYVSNVGPVIKDIIDGHKVVAMRFDCGELGWYYFAGDNGWTLLRTLTPDEISESDLLRSEHRIVYGH